MRRSSRGYTIIELMIVVILIAIIAALAIPQINQAARNNALTDATNEMALILRKARSRAARTGKAHRVYINASSTGTNQLIRVDEGLDDSCREFPVGCSEVGPGYGADVRCGVAALRFDHGFYDRNGVQISKVQRGFPGKVVNSYNSVSSLCITPRGRLFALTTECASDYPQLPDGPLVVTLDRHETAPGWLGVRRCVIFPERGMPRTAFGSACPSST